MYSKDPAWCDLQLKILHNCVETLRKPGQLILMSVLVLCQDPGRSLQPGAAPFAPPADALPIPEVQRHFHLIDIILLGRSVLVVCKLTELGAEGCEQEAD